MFLVRSVPHKKRFLTRLPTKAYMSNISGGGSGGGVPSARTISTTAPLAGGGDLSVNRTFSIPQATAGANGFLTSTDWAGFNAKIDPAPASAQTVQPTVDVTGLIVKQSNTANTANIFEVQLKDASKVFYVDKSGNSFFGASGGGSTEWTTGAMSVSDASTVRVGANTGNVFSVSESAGTVTPVLIGNRTSYGLKTCMIIVGADNGAVLADADLGPQGQQCIIPYAATVIEVDVSADGTATPQVIIRKKAGNGTTYTDLLSAALATSGTSNNNFACASINAACVNGAAKSGAVTIVTAASANVLAAGDSLGLTSGTAGGAAKRMTIAIHYTVN